MTTAPSPQARYCAHRRCRRANACRAKGRGACKAQAAFRLSLEARLIEAAIKLADAPGRRPAGPPW